MTSTYLGRKLPTPARNDNTAHLFTIGDTVRLKIGFKLPSQASGIYRITGVLPPSGEYPQYRIRSAVERHDRVVTQDNLEAI